MKIKTVMLLTALSLSVPAANFAFAQQPVTSSDATMSSAVNHESGTIDEVLTASDKGYLSRGYIVNWRNSRIFVAGSPDDPRKSGDSVDFKVYRSNANGKQALRFSTSQTDTDSNVAQDESKNARVSVTSGTSKVDDVLLADNDGYHFIAYMVMWHDTRVVVVDPLLHVVHATGDQINFKVLHTGAADNQQLAFALEE